MKRNTLLYIGICALFTLFLTSCDKGDKKKYDEMGDHGKTARTENLQENLKETQKLVINQVIKSLLIKTLGIIYKDLLKI